MPRQMITSGGLGTMGYGLPAAIGAAIGRPDCTVIDIDGDASYLMTSYELATIAQYKIPVKVAILNNAFQGMVRQWQEMFFDERYCATEMINPDFAANAESFGIRGIRCTERDQVGDVVREMLNHEGPVVVDFDVEIYENVYPMVAAGKALDEMDMGQFGALA